MQCLQRRNAAGTVRALGRTRPPTIPYPGAKGRLASSLVALMPGRGHRYIEPFVGRGNVYFAAAGDLLFDEWWINDIATAPFFRALVQTEGRITVPVRSREVYHVQKQRYQRGDAAAILLEPYLTYSGGGYLRGGFGGARSAGPVSYANTLQTCAGILKTTAARITDLDWEQMGMDRFDKGDFVFLDPPYYAADVRAYSNKFDHPRLVAALKKARFSWMLTEYRQDLYVRAFGEPSWTTEVQLACDGRGTSRRVECVWKNF